jgi:hypothetical protein
LQGSRQSNDIVGAVDKYGGPALGNAVRNVQSLGRSAKAFADKFKKKPPATVNVIGANGTAKPKDNRVRILVPGRYLAAVAPTSEFGDYSLSNIGGIIFPYTPQINFDTNADYQPLSPVHSNFTQYFYKNSNVSAITIVGKFTVQNDKDAENLLATHNLLRILTKMKFGTDETAGAPPPVCRLQAYGDRMLDNTPIVLKQFRLDLSETVDYYTLYKASSTSAVSVPVSSTVNIICLPVYSRQEIKDFSVDNWLASGRKNGYL